MPDSDHPGSEEFHLAPGLKIGDIFEAFTQEVFDAGKLIDYIIYELS